MIWDNCRGQITLPVQLPCTASTVLPKTRRQTQSLTVLSQLAPSDLAPSVPARRPHLQHNHSHKQRGDLLPDAAIRFTPSKLMRKLHARTPPCLIPFCGRQSGIYYTRRRSLQQPSGTLSSVVCSCRLHVIYKRALTTFANKKSLASPPPRFRLLLHTSLCGHFCVQFSKPSTLPP